MMWARCVAGVVLGASVLVAAGTASSQTGDVAAAAAAFQEGQRLQLGREYARAAEMFELADGAAPSPAALRSAIRNHLAAGQRARAASLALRAQTRDAADPQSVALAAEVQASEGPQLARVSVRCTPACTLSVDGRAVSSQTAAAHAFYADPGPRALEIVWGPGRTRSRPLTLAAGQQTELELEAPPEPPTPPPTPPPAPVIVVTPPPPAPIQVAPEAPPRPLSPVIFAVGAGLTAVSAGLLLWSGLDTLEARDAYVQSPSEAGYNDGVSREVRTNVLLGTTLGLGVATAVVGVFFTRWRARPATPTLTPTAGGVSLGLGGAF